MVVTILMAFLSALCSQEAWAGKCDRAVVRLTVGMQDRSAYATTHWPMWLQPHAFVAASRQQGPLVLAESIGDPVRDAALEYVAQVADGEADHPGARLDRHVESGTDARGQHVAEAAADKLDLAAPGRPLELVAVLPKVVVDSGACGFVVQRAVAAHRTVPVLNGVEAVADHPVDAVLDFFQQLLAPLRRQSLVAASESDAEFFPALVLQFVHGCSPGVDASGGVTTNNVSVLASNSSPSFSYFCQMQRSVAVYSHIPDVFERHCGMANLSTAVVADDLGDVGHEALKGVEAFQLACCLGIGQQARNDFSQFLGGHLLAHAIDPPPGPRRSARAAGRSDRKSTR